MFKQSLLVCFSRVDLKERQFLGLNRRSAKSLVGRMLFRAEDLAATLTLSNPDPLLFSYAPELE